MKIIIAALFVPVLLSAFGCSRQADQAAPGPRQQFPNGELVDLSHEFSEDTVYWVTAKEFKRETVAEGKTEQGFFYSAYNYEGAEHGGTHIDAPIHFAEGRHSVDQIPLENLFAEAIKIDISGKTQNNSDYLISIEDLTDWELQNGQIPDGCIVLLQTGFGRFYPDKLKYLGTDKRGEVAVADLHFPGLDPKAAEWLVKNRKIKAIGIDTASIDYGQSRDFASHVALMTNNIPAFENVANLDKVPLKGANVVALPMKIKGGSGAPLRIVAIVPAG